MNYDKKKNEEILRTHDRRDSRGAFYVLTGLGMCVLLFIFLRGPILNSGHPILYTGLALCIPALYAVICFVDKIRMDGLTGRNPIDLKDTILEDDGDWTIIELEDGDKN